jgi:hypothetical protein
MEKAVQKDTRTSLLYMPVILALGRQKQKDLSLRPGLHCEILFQKRLKDSKNTEETQPLVMHAS